MCIYVDPGPDPSWRVNNMTNSICETRTAEMIIGYELDIRIRLKRSIFKYEYRMSINQSMSFAIQ